eukprot:scaffold19546_cov79-Phaeocystis_antarctica.AAC.3
MLVLLLSKRCMPRIAAHSPPSMSSFRNVGRSCGGNTVSMGTAMVRALARWSGELAAPRAASASLEPIVCCSAPWLRPCLPIAQSETVSDTHKVLSWTSLKPLRRTELSRCSTFDGLGSKTIARLPT